MIGMEFIGCGKKAMRPPFFCPEERGCGMPGKRAFENFEGRPCGGPMGAGFRGPEMRPCHGPMGQPFGGPEGHPFPGHGRRPFPPMFDPDSLMGLWIRSHKALERRPSDHRGVRRVLRLLELGDGSLSQRELTELMDVQPGSLSELLGKMEFRGLITRERDEQDRRKVTVSLTEAGKEKAAQRGKRDIFAALDESEKEQLKAILSKLVASWEDRPQADAEQEEEITD